MCFCALALSGCYFDGMFGGSAPIGHGHGNANGEVEVAFGLQSSDPHKVYGAGMLTGLRFAHGEALIPLAAHLHGVLSLSRDRDYDGKQFRPLLVGNLAFGVGLAASDPDPGEPAIGGSGGFGEAFLGVGVGSPYKDPNSGAKQGHVAIGALVTWFDPFEREPAYWMIGGGLQISLGALQGGEHLE